MSLRLLSLFFLSLAFCGANCLVIQQLRRQAGSLRSPWPRKGLTNVRLRCSPDDKGSRGSSTPSFPSKEGIDQNLVGDGKTASSSLSLSDALQSVNPYLLLNFVALLFGTQHVCIKSSLDVYSSTSLVNFWRFFLSAALFSPALLRVLRNMDLKGPVLRAGLELGVYTFLGFAFQAVGLETTTASRSAFLLYLNVKFVPILLAVFFGRSIPAVTWASAAAAFTGTFLLANDGAPPNVGDFWCMAAAVASAMFILRLEFFKDIKEADELNGVSFATVAALCAVWVAGDFYAHPNLDATGHIPSLVSQIVAPFLASPWPVVYLGFVSTGLCNYLQTLGQRRVPAERAALIYSLDPIYGAFFSRIFLDERLGPMGYAGVALIMAGVWLSSRGRRVLEGDADADADALADVKHESSRP
jgi:drug/metabolite transporter (DMT)-like permease